MSVESAPPIVFEPRHEPLSLSEEEVQKIGNAYEEFLNDHMHIQYLLTSPEIATFEVTVDYSKAEKSENKMFGPTLKIYREEKSENPDIYFRMSANSSLPNTKHTVFKKDKEGKYSLVETSYDNSHKNTVVDNVTRGIDRIKQIEKVRASKGDPLRYNVR